MKLQNRYNLQSFHDFQNSRVTTGFKDSYAGSVLERNLLAINPRILEKKFPELAFVNSGIEADNSGGYAPAIESLRLQPNGQFTIAGDYSTNKGKITIAGEADLLKVLTKEAHSIWSNTEIQRAALQNINLPERYVTYHNTIYMREIDSIGLLGINGVGGLLTNKFFPTDTAPKKIGTLDPQSMYQAVADFLIKQFDSVNNTPEYKANKLIIPVSLYNKLRGTIMNGLVTTPGGVQSVNIGQSSVLAYLQANFPDVDFVSSARAEDIDGAGTTAMVAFSTSNEAMVMRLPIPLTIGNVVQANSFEFRVDSFYCIAGLDIYEKTAGRIMVKV